MAANEYSAACHPTAEAISRFVTGRVSADERRRILGHALRECPSCRAELARASTVLGRPPLAPNAAERYEAAIDRAIDTAKAFGSELALARRESKEEIAETWSAEMMPLPKEEPIERFAQAEAWLDWARSQRRKSPKRGLLAAILASCLADALDPAEHPPQTVSDLRAESWAEVGNHHRLLGSLRLAEGCFLKALSVSEDEGVSFEAMARILELVTAFLGEQRRYAEADDLLARLEAGYLEKKELHLAGRTKLRRGLFARRATHVVAAQVHLADALRLLDRTREPELGFVAAHNLVLLANDLGEHEVALEALRRCRSLYFAYGQPSDQAKYHQLEAKLLAAQGFYLGAEPAYRRAIRALADLGLKDAAAVATLELCAVWVRLGKTADVKTEIEKVVRHFRAACAGPEVLASLGLLRKAARAEAVTVALLEQATAAVERRGAGRGR